MANPMNMDRMWDDGAVPVTHLLCTASARRPSRPKVRQVAARVCAQHPGVTWWCPAAAVSA